MKNLKYLLLIIPFIFISNVKATTITDYQYQMRYFTYSITDKSDVASESGWTSYHSPSEGYSLVLYGKDDYSPTNDKFQYMSGFDTKINYPINKGVSYTATLVFTFSSISDNEFSSSRLNYFTNSNLVRVSNSAYSYGSVSYSKNNCFNYSSVKYCTYTATVNYSFTAISDASNIALGSWNNNGSGFAFFEHNLTSSFSLNSISIDKNADNTIINQNQTIINQNQGIINNQNKTNEKLDKVNDNITNNNVSDAENQAGGFFNDFTTDTHGLTAIITAPLSLIESITSSTCSPLVIPLPYVDKDLTLPCMGSIYSNYFGSFLSIYQMITFGIVAYWVLVRIFNLVKDFKNPDHDEIEVLDL